MKKNQACISLKPGVLMQRFRFMTAMLHSVCTILEFITPMFPNQFLLLASLANVGKSIGLTTYVSTQPAVLKSFAKGENVAELSAKQQVIYPSRLLFFSFFLSFLFSFPFFSCFLVYFRELYVFNSIMLSLQACI